MLHLTRDNNQNSLIGSADHFQIIYYSIKDKVVPVLKIPLYCGPQQRNIGYKYM
ncbi:hypothetical protein C2G38_2109388, partial [Gigaspora rosea]